MNGPDCHYYVTAMKTEISQLLKQNTWKRMRRDEVPTGRKILKSTWTFKLKRLPDGTPLKYKARFCVRGDL